MATLPPVGEDLVVPGSGPPPAPRLAVAPVTATPAVPLGVPPVPPVKYVVNGVPAPAPPPVVVTSNSAVPSVGGGAGAGAGAGAGTDTLVFNGGMGPTLSQAAVEASVNRQLRAPRALVVATAGPWHRPKTYSDTCKACGTQFDPETQDCPQPHWEKKDLRRFLCLVLPCTHISPDLSHAVEHARTHSGARPHVCRHCPYKARTKSALGSHVKRKHTGMERAWNCPHPKCDSRFKTRSECKSHVFRVHENRRRFTCSVEGCNFKTDHQAQLRQHVKGVHEKVKDIKCTIPGCLFVSAYKEALWTHMKNIHKSC